MKVDQVEEPDVGKEQRLAMARGLRSKLNSIWACIEKDDDVVKEMEIRLVARKIQQLQAQRLQEYKVKRILRKKTYGRGNWKTENDIMKMVEMLKAWHPLDQVADSRMDWITYEVMVHFVTGADIVMELV